MKVIKTILIVLSVWPDSLNKFVVDAFLSSQNDKRQKIFSFNNVDFSLRLVGSETNVSLLLLAVCRRTSRRHR